MDKRLAKQILRCARLLISGWQRELADYYGDKAEPERKDEKRISDMADKADDKVEKKDADFEEEILKLAQRMADSIGSSDKAYRRGRAAEEENFHEVAAVFFERAEDLWEDGK